VSPEFLSLREASPVNIVWYQGLCYGGCNAEANPVVKYCSRIIFCRAKVENRREREDISRTVSCERPERFMSHINSLHSSINQALCDIMKEKSKENREKYSKV